ncbi:MAG: hypothetical protein HFH85_00435 [Lachnospiraceae bacterium]|nr:hypothetical protein [Lachnospiraceae bacterium]
MNGGRNWDFALKSRAFDSILNKESKGWADAELIKQQQSAQVPRRNTGTVLVTGFLLPCLVLARIVAELD